MAETVDTLRVRSGSVIGFGHHQKETNNQDGRFVGFSHIKDRIYHYGAVLDGCTNKTAKGPKSRNEVGASLLAHFIGNEIPLLLSAGLDIKDVPAALYQRCIGVLGSIARTTTIGGIQEMSQFVQTFLLCTIVGFIDDGQSLVFFTAGDGIIIVNDEIKIIDQDDRPTYIGYHLIDRSLLGSHAALLPQTFEVSIYDASTVRRFAVASDGLKPQASQGIQAVEGIWTNEQESKAGLQWWLKCNSNESIYRDDCTVIAAEVVPVKTGG